jgi:serine/threonine protein kinase
MDARRWLEVDRVFAEALEVPPAQRSAYLGAACAADADLQWEVERLLAADEHAAQFMEQQAGELSDLLAEREDGKRLGPYRLLSRLGAGGAGTVYLARRDDEEYDRQVAIKILHAELEGTEANHRFLAERQILARLEHPNVARLYDGGSTEDGRPFLVMELVEGLPVDLYCDRHRLSVDQRLDLFRRICGAVEYAHRNLLVHRDLKPANILVTGGGEPKLLDFGIAKQLEPLPGGGEGVTRTGLRLLTPFYASPEQIRGEAITTASDIYSLGVMLHELLTGRSPYRLGAGHLHEVGVAICEQESERPSQALWRPARGEGGRRGLPVEEAARARGLRPAALSRRLLGDLDNIVLTALRKEPQRRYSSVSQLSDDVLRHLRNWPVSARPDTLPYRLRKFVRRNRAAVFAAAAAAVLAVGSIWSLVAEERRLARERDKSRYALAFLVDTFKRADPYHALGKKLGVQDLLTEAEARISRDLAEQPDAQATLMSAIGEVDLGLGRYDQAQPLLERSLALRQRLLGDDSLEVAADLDLLGRLRQERSDFAGAEALLRRSLALKRRQLGGRNLDVAKTLTDLGDVLAEKGAPRDAEALHRQALAIAREAEKPAGVTVAHSILSLAQLAEGRGDYSAAAALYREGLALDRKVLGDRDPRLYHDQSDYGEVLLNLGKFKEAEQLLRSTLAAQQAMLGRDHPDMMSTLNNLAMALHHLERYAEAEAIDREILALARSRYGPTHYRVAAVLGNLAAAVLAQGKTREAVPYLVAALELRRRNQGDNHPLVAQALLLLAGARRDLGEGQAALALARQALAILGRTEGLEHPHAAYGEREIGRDYFALGQYAAAEAHLRRSLEIRRRQLRADHPEVARAKSTLAACLIQRRRYREAESLLREADAALSAQFAASDDAVREVRAMLARLPGSNPPYASQPLAAAGAGGAAIPSLVIPAGRGVLVDGVIDAQEWSDAAAVIIPVRSGWEITAYCKHDRQNLYFAFKNLEHEGTRLFPELLIDARGSRSKSWQTGVWWFHASQNLCEANGQHDLYRRNGRFACAHEEPGWHANNPPGGDAVEFRITLEKLALPPHAQFGIALDVTNATGDAKQEWHFWPPAARLDQPSSWGKALFD